MKEKPILMSTEMVKAILEGRKTQTRRVVSFKKCWPFDKSYSWPYVKQLNDGTWMWSTSPTFDYTESYMKDGIKCPYGQTSDRFYVKETHYRFGHWVKNGLTKTGRQKWLFKTNNDEVRFIDNPPTENVHRLGEKDAIGWFKRSSLFLPKKLARIHGEYTNIRVERLQDITEEDAKAEGTGILPSGGSGTYRGAFYRYWDTLNAKRGYSWESNPWVWILEFKKI